MASKTAELLFGFKNLNDIINERVTGDRISAVRTAIEDTVRNHNLVTERLLALFVTKTTDFKIRYKSPVSANLMGLDENGRARKVKLAGFYDAEFPLRAAGIATGTTRLARIKRTVQDENDDLALILSADNIWMRDQILGAIVTKEEYTFTDESYGNLTIKGLANGDTTKYLLRSGAVDGSTANHFLTVAAISDANVAIFNTIYNSIASRPENSGGQVVTFVHSDDAAAVEALAAFVDKEDPDIRPSLTAQVLVGTLDADIVGEIIGKVGRNWIVRWDGVPTGYMISLSTAGDRPIAMREHAEPELQGFQAVGLRDDHPYSEVQYERFAGFGGFNRVGAVVTQITAGAYVTPPALKQPMAA